MARAYLGLGSNLCDPPRQLQRASARLRAHPALLWVASSPVYASLAWDGSAQPEYYNAVVAIETALAPRALLEVLLAIEVELGRRRNGRRYEPRLIDLDLLLYDQLQHHDVHLQLPHPHLHERAFVVEPLYRLAPELILPDGRSIATLRATIDRDSICLVPISLEP